MKKSSSNRAKFTINCVLLYWRHLPARLLYNDFDYKHNFSLASLSSYAACVRQEAGRCCIEYSVSTTRFSGYKVLSESQKPRKLRIASERIDLCNLSRISIFAIYRCAQMMILSR